MATQAIEIEIPCNGTLLPTRADLNNIFAQLSQLAVRPDVGEQVNQEVQKILDDIDSFLGKFPISVPDPLYANLRIPEIEWERKIAALIQEYQLYVQAKIMELIDAILPIDFEIEVLGITIDVVKLWSDPEYIAELKMQVCDNIDELYLLVPETYRTFAGEFGVDSEDIRCETTWSYIMNQLNAGAIGLIHAAFGGLIDKFSEIWDLLGLPSLPALLTLNPEQIINEFIEKKKQQFKDAPDNLKQEIREEIDELLSEINIAGFSLDDIIGQAEEDIEEFIISTERKIERKMEAIRDFAENWPQYLIKKWMEKIQEFLDAIGLGALLDWATFDFCDFLTLVGLPTSFTLPALPSGIDFNIPDIGGKLEEASHVAETVENYINPPEEEEGGG